MSNESRIVECLSDGKEWFGLDLVKADCGNRGGIYVTLGTMERDGKITSRKEDTKLRAGQLPRRLYSLATTGSN